MPRAKKCRSNTAMMENNSSSDDPPLSKQQQPRRKRRRKRKSSAQRIGSSGSNNNDANLRDESVGWRHQNTTVTTSSSNCDALDAELENQVNKLIFQSNHLKKKRVAADSCNTTCADKLVVNAKSPNDMSSSLPILLHTREVGLSSRLGRHRTKIPFVKNVDSLDANGNNASWMTLLLRQPAYSRRKERMDKQHCSGLSLDTAVANDSNDHHRDLSNRIRWLRVPVHNRQALHDDDDKYKDSKSNEATTIYRRKIWRPYTQQTIQFSKLNTPHSVAILAMDEWGGYAIGVAGMCSSGAGRGDSSLLRPSLSLQFYGIPSPAKLLSSSGQSSTSSSMISPLVHSVPLLLSNPYTNTESEEGPIQISDTPIQILLCSNGAFGVGYVLDSRATVLLRIDIFSRSPALQVRKCCLVEIYSIPCTTYSCSPISVYCVTGRLDGNGGHL